MNSCCHSVQNLLFSSFLSKNIKINPSDTELNPICHLLALLGAHHILHISRIRVKTYRNIILLVLNGCETWSLTLREERRLRVFENRVLRRIFGTGRDEVTGEWRKLHDEELNDLYCSPNIVRVMKSRRMRWTGHVARRVWGRVEVHTEFSWGNLREGDHLEDPGLDGRMILNGSLGSGMWEFRLDRAGSG